MLVNTKDLISLTEANQNFSKVVRKVDEKGSVYNNEKQSSELYSP